MKTGKNFFFTNPRIFTWSIYYGTDRVTRYYMCRRHTGYYYISGLLEKYQLEGFALAVLLRITSG